jgi:hypothetical protein
MEFSQGSESHTQVERENDENIGGGARWVN